MDRIPGIRRLFRHDPTPERVARDVRDEIEFHIDNVTEELMARGLKPDEARREAARRFGDVERHRASLESLDSDTATRVKWTTRLSDAGSDLRYAVRGLLREPMFTLGVVATLGIGLAANATMFGVIDRLLLRPPPHVADDPRMTLVYFTKQVVDREGKPTGAAFTQSGTSYPDFATLRDSSSAFSETAAFWTTNASLGRGRDAQKVRVGLATGNMFTLLGTRPSLGRFFGPTDDDPAATDQAVVLSDAMWRGTYDADPAILGRTMRIDQRTYTVVGVAPPGFNGPQTRRVDLWLPLRLVSAELLGPDWETTRNMYWLRVVARRRADITTAMAGERATLVHQRANRAAGREDSTATVKLGSIVPARGAGAGGGGMVSGGGMITGQSGMTPEARIATWLTGVAAVVLLIVCANVANLLLSRANRRRREIAVRLAMGIRRGRLIRQLLTESALLALIGGGVGLLLAYWGSQFIRSLLLGATALEVSVADPRVLLFTLGASAVTALLAGLAPALVSSVPDLTSVLRSGVREGGHRRTRLQRGLLMAQAALSVLLLAGAGLFVRSLHNVASLRLGYDAEQVLVANLDATVVTKNAQEVNRFWDDARERVQRIPGVRSASLAVTTPFQSAWSTDFSLPGRAKLPNLADGGPYVNAVSADFLETLGTRVVRGRGFASSDVQGAEQVAVVNEYMASQLWPDGNALGQCMKVGADTVPCTTVIGITENAFRDDLRQKLSAQYLVLLAQRTWDAEGMRTLFIRAGQDAERLIPLIREELQSIRPDLPFAEVRTLRSIIDPEMQQWRLGAAMFGLFGLAALLVAAIGLYSVVAYDVSQRRQELGVRAALGAKPGDLLRLIVSDGIRQALVGVTAGIVIALYVAPWLESMLYDVGARDAATLVTVAVVLLVAAVIASAIPARKASRIPPSEVLRGE
jgi:predicted permease